MLICLLGLTACGFQLRGEATMPAEMDRTYIQTDDRHSPFYVRLRDEFRTAGIEVVDSPVDAKAIFVIETDVTSQRVLAVSARNVPREYEVFYTISYSLMAEQDTLMDRRSQTKTQAYTWDETEVLGKTREEELLRNAIADDLVRVVMIQLAAL